MTEDAQLNGRTTSHYEKCIVRCNALLIFNEHLKRRDKVNRHYFDLSEKSTWTGSFQYRNELLYHTQSTYV